MTQFPDRSRWFVSTEWLEAHLNSPDIAIVDASWYLPAINRNADAEYAESHIPGAVRFDIDKIADTSSSLPHMLPGAEAFSSVMRKMGIGDGMTIVVYDGAGLFAAPRVAWTFRVFGVKDVFILDGGLPKWKAEKRPLTSEVPERPQRHFTARLDHSMVRDFDDVKSAITTRSVQVVDARPAGRFKGAEPEPRPGLRSGHMPGAANVPATEAVSEGKLKSAEDLAAIFAQAGVDPSAPIIASCGSGVTAAILWLGLETIGAPKLALYDGSWAEWGSRPDADIVTD